MKNSGFTLVELLGVIAIIVIIFILVVPNVNMIVNKGKETTYDRQISVILNAAYDLSLKNSDILPKEDNIVYITLSELKEEGLVDADIKNPNTREPFNDSLVISIKRVETSYENHDKLAKKNGNYLYSIVKDSISPTSTNNKPIITLNNLTANSSGNYITSIDLNGTFEEATYKATSSSGEDLTDKVRVRITYNDTQVSSIDTKKAGIYHINYTVVDDNGVSNSITRSIIVADDEKPVLKIPGSATISINEETFDLMKDVICNDNSSYCTVETTGTIEFGKAGKYIIEYVAKDPSGNTTTAKRVITIE